MSTSILITKLCRVCNRNQLLGTTDEIYSHLSDAEASRVYRRAQAKQQRADKLGWTSTHGCPECSAKAEDKENGIREFLYQTK